MPNLACTCGATLNYGEIPCPIEWLLFSDSQFDALPPRIETEALYRQAISLLRCPQCARLWVFWKGFGEPPQEYTAAICRPEQAGCDALPKPTI